MSKTLICNMCSGKFTPIRNGQKQCSIECGCAYFDSVKMDWRKKRAFGRKLALTLGFQSLNEAKFSRHLDDLGITWKYEEYRFRYSLQKPFKCTCKHCGKKTEVSKLDKHYTPDFSIYNSKGELVMYVEYKGKIEQTTRKKMEMVKLYNPSIDIRFVFEKQTQKIYKGSKTTVREWALKKGFKVSTLNKKFDNNWLNELK